ncbi:MAG TPA: BadF/BadG/BcrA/BcrD ATPase family protein [Verrucomicrobiae bacterium]|nr:BadF/BadG/BcrA/BcrD ATPase family protein [Verrucomicrobiae bacterium]
MNEALHRIPGTGARAAGGRGIGRFLGIDIGAETIKLVELWREPQGLRIGRSEVLEHGNTPRPKLLEALARWDWSSVSGARVSGRFSTQVNLSRIPTKQAQSRGYRFLFGDQPATLINIGSHGFSVLELRGTDLTVFRENSRCSQGTGNFLRQLVERFSLTVEQASLLCAEVPDPAPLSGRCPVILKTDMTHLANKGEDRARILAGLFDAVCENILVLLRPGRSPGKVRLAGGVSRSQRVQRVFAQALARQGMELLPFAPPTSLCLEAIGCALLAADAPAPVPELSQLLLAPRPLNLERLPSLQDSLPKVRRFPAQPWAAINGETRRVMLGFDIGSTGSKLLALDAASLEILWEGYRQTLGDPVGAAQDLLRNFTTSKAAKFPVAGFGVTGSGREIAGSLLTSCYGPNAVFVVNEIVAHATGALHYEPRVDTIFEIGGQDAKYIRLTEGRIIDSAMNEACSAGTGSFIEEQGRKFSGITDIRHLAQAALAAPAGVSLGQHCSVFMAEVIDESVAAGTESSAIISGLYDSIIKNYLNRVKGNRSLGKFIFCQGMPFSADALAAAVARQTGSDVFVPPNPGMVGALGIALLAGRELRASEPHKPSAPAVDLELFLGAKVEQKDTFACGSNRGCGGAGNHCRIERLRTVVNRQHSLFTWGGGCALHDKATRKRKLPDRAPDPFRQRDELMAQLLAPLRTARGFPRVALADEFMLKGLFPFFAGYLHEAGLDLELVSGAEQATLKRGIQCANVPFCAPMQLFHGLVEAMVETGAPWLLAPMVRSLPQSQSQSCAVVCPIVQAGPDLVKDAVARKPGIKLLAPRIDFGPGGFASREFLQSCRALGQSLGLGETQAHAAYQAGLRLQQQFDAGCERIGREALDFCQTKQLIPVVVLGRSYTIYNRILNSNVPALLREQGAVAVPADCYPLSPETPHFGDMYWAYGQSLLRAAHQVRRTPGVYALYCTNYSCGPDSFNLHFASYIMQGKPFAIIETDGHSGDAGTKTRLEAFLHCVEEERRAAPASNGLQNSSSHTLDPSLARTLPLPFGRGEGRGEGSLYAANPTLLSITDFSKLAFANLRLRDIGRVNGATERLLVPALGHASEAVAVVFRGAGLNAEALPLPNEETLQLGRRYTSGKECLPMPLTLGSLLQRLQRASPGQRFVYVMPSTDGPCRFGVYNLLNQIVLERLGWQDRLRIWSPKDTGYFDDLPAGTEILMLTGILGTDLLMQALLDTRPTEHRPGGASSLYSEFFGALLALLETAGRGRLSLAAALWQVASGDLFGIRELLQRAGCAFAELRGAEPKPLVELTGEIYVRAVPFANDFLAEKLEARGLRVRLAPQSEWIAYCGYLQRQAPGRNRLAKGLSAAIQHRIEALCQGAIGRPLGWPVPLGIAETLSTAAPFVSPDLYGEAILTVGGALAGWRDGQLDAVISVGPLECMPTKIAEAQFHHLAERERLLSLTLSFNGDPINSEILDNFAFEVHERFARRRPKVRNGLNHKVHKDEKTPMNI